MTHGGGGDDRIDDVCGAGGGAGDPGSAADVLVIGHDVAALEHAGDLVLRAAAPGLGQDRDGHDGTDVRGSQFVVQGQEVGVAAFGGQQCAGIAR